MPRQLYILVILLIQQALAVAQPVSAYTEKDVPGVLQKIKNGKDDSSAVELLIKLAEYYVLKKKALVNDIDSSLLLAKQGRDLSIKINYAVGKGKSYLVSSMALREGTEYGQGKNAINTAIEVFSAINNQQLLGESYIELSMYYSTLRKELPEKIRLMQLAAASFQQSGKPLREADCFKEIGDYHQIQGNFSQSLTDLKTALKLYQSIKYPSLMGVYDLLGFVSTSLGDRNEGIRYGLLAVETAEQLKDSTAQLCTIYNRLGITYFSVNEYDKAGIYFQKALSIAIRLNDQDAVYELAFNYSNLLLRLRKPSEALLFLRNIVKKYPVMDVDSRIRVTVGFVTIYETLNRYPMAKLYCDQLLEIIKTSELNDEEQGLIYSAMIPFYLAINQYPEAKRYLVLNKTLAEKTGSLMNLSINHLWWFKLDSAQSNYPSAIWHYQQYKTLNDSLFNEAKSRHINQLEILYNMEKKDQDIQLKEQNIQLLIKQSQLQQTRLEQANLLKNVTFGGASLLLIIVGLLFNRYRLKQKSNKELQEQQKEINQKNASLQHLVDEKEWLLKEIHHRIKNNLHMVAGLLDTQSGFLKTEEARQAIFESQQRVNAMSMVHQKLYQSENLSAIDMAAYIHELVAYLKDSFSSGQRILFKLYIDRVLMNLSHSIPLGLILNEAITNAIKYAFPGDRYGIIVISLTYATPYYVLNIADNGIGLPEGFNKLQMNSLGMSLMQGLSEDINGDFTIDSNNGTKIKITFTYNHTETSGLPLALSEKDATETSIYE